MDIAKAKKLAERLMREHGLTEKGWTLRMTTALTTKAGTCDWRKKRINMNSIYVFSNTESVVRDTVLHEIAHALNDWSLPFHGPEWRAIAASIGCTGNRYVMPSANWMGRVAQAPRLTTKTDCE
jgi:predicted SprT family Zn-dependent metalloprotease